MVIMANAKDLKDMSLDEMLEYMETSIEGKKRKEIMEILEERSNQVGELLRIVMLEEKIREYYESLKKRYFNVTFYDCPTHVKISVKCDIIYLQDFDRSFIYDVEFVDAHHVDVYISKGVE
nr:MAG: hypothetical protein [Microvirus Sku119]